MCEASLTARNAAMLKLPMLKVLDAAPTTTVGFQDLIVRRARASKARKMVLRSMVVGMRAGGCHEQQFQSGVVGR